MELNQSGYKFNELVGVNQDGLMKIPTKDGVVDVFRAIVDDDIGGCDDCCFRTDNQSMRGCPEIYYDYCIVEGVHYQKVNVFKKTPTNLFKVFLNGEWHIVDSDSVKPYEEPQKVTYQFRVARCVDEWGGFKYHTVWDTEQNINEQYKIYEDVVPEIDPFEPELFVCWVTDWIVDTN